MTLPSLINAPGQFEGYEGSWSVLRLHQRRVNGPLTRLWKLVKRRFSGLETRSPKFPVMRAATPRECHNGRRE